MTHNELHHIRVKILGVTQVHLANILGVDKNVYNRWENGYCNIPNPKVLELALKQISSDKKSKLEKFLLQGDLLDKS